MSNTLIYYIYAYINKKTGRPYYIGKGKNNRAFRSHGRVTVPKDKTKIVFLETNLTELGAFALERRLISWWGRKDIDTGILLNKTDGGEGPAGMNVSDETKAKLSAALKGKPGPNKGKTFSDETRAKLSASHMGQEASDETRAKLSAALKGRVSPNKGNKFSDEVKAKLSALRMGKSCAEDTKAKISEAMKRTCAAKRALINSTNIAS